MLRGRPVTYVDHFWAIVLWAIVQMQESTPSATHDSLLLLRLAMPPGYGGQD
jgi:hypothetical protein